MKRLPPATFAKNVRRALFIAVFGALIVFVGRGLEISAVSAQDLSTEQPDGRYRTLSPYCRKLQRKLASDWVRGHQPNNLLPDLNKRIRKQDRLFNKFQNRADRMDCYENMFIFGRSLRRTRKCIAIDRKIRTAKRSLARLREERSSIKDSQRGGNRRNRIIDELARNNCGDQYRYEARRNSGSWLEDNFGDLFGGYSRPRRRQNSGNDSILPYATYRTMCVRLCDGYYFPVSFSTLPSSFPKDTDVCANKCAAPAELYVYRNPGGEVEQMISPDGLPYDSIENAWRYRKEYIKGCSCKETEYSQIDIDEHNNPSNQAKSQASSNETNSSQSSRKSDPSVFDKAKSIDDLIR